MSSTFPLFAAGSRTSPTLWEYLFFIASTLAKLIPGLKSGIKLDPEFQNSQIGRREFTFLLSIL